MCYKSLKTESLSSNPITMNRIICLYSRSSKAHFIGIGVILLLSIVICVGVSVTRLTGSSSTLSPSFQRFKEKLAKIDHSVQWVNYNTINVSLTDVFIGDQDENKDFIYACRVDYNSEISEVIPGTYYPKKQRCLFSYGGKTLEKDEFQLLTTKDQSALIWIKRSNDEVYNGAITGGLNAFDEELWIARVNVFGYRYAIGKIYNRYKLAHVPDGYEEYDSQQYDVLCLEDFAL
ncbi:uncharacterized protein LOC128390861 [Panonychus citri]|uniref:uncharacterized protein LOC128390861 n=1 Tax=Panonychus citri TaxID=50023 RepID=UPI002306E744|nr:uncharacterized protein LOC128390861 [Panonychus citri]